MFAKTNLVSWYLSHANILESAIHLHFDFDLQFSFFK